MTRRQDIPKRRELQVQLADAGAQVFRLGLQALHEMIDLPPLYEDKPLRCISMNFARSFDERRMPEQLDEIKTELLQISIIDPKAIDAADKSALPEDSFIHPNFPRAAKKRIRNDAKQIGDTLFGQVRGVPNHIIKTEYIVQYFNGSSSMVDSAEYWPNTIKLVAGRYFATEVLGYMQTERYSRHPSRYSQLYDEKTSGEITHAVIVPYATRPPINGGEQQTWLKGYAKWLQKSIDDHAPRPKDPTEERRFLGITSSAIDDGILLLTALEALKRRG